MSDGQRLYVILLTAIMLPLMLVVTAVEVIAYTCPDGTMHATVRLLPFKKVCVK